MFYALFRNGLSGVRMLTGDQAFPLFVAMSRAQGWPDATVQARLRKCRLECMPGSRHVTGPMSTFAEEHRLCDVRVPPKVSEGLDAWADGLIGTWQRHRGMVSELRRDAEKVDAFGAVFLCAGAH